MSTPSGPRAWEKLERLTIAHLTVGAHFSEYQEIPNFAVLQQQVRENGGKIVVYRSCWSALVFLRMTERAVWIAPGESRALRGFLHSITTILVGWPSLFGIGMAPAIVSFNLSGGRDITKLVAAPAPPVGSPEYAAAVAEIEEEKNRPSRWQLVILLLVVAGIVGYALSLADWNGFRLADALKAFGDPLAPLR